MALQQRDQCGWWRAAEDALASFQLINGPFVEDSRLVRTITIPQAFQHRAGGVFNILKPLVDGAPADERVKPLGSILGHDARPALGIATI